jgi:Tfp pilus assembly protein PilV
MRRQRGVTLIEALVALLVMSFGMLALVGLMSNLRRGADLAKQRSEAMRIARAELTTMRTFSQRTRTGVTPATVTTYSDIVSQGPVARTPPDSNTTYNVQRFVTPLPDDSARQIRVTVSWTDRANETQFVNLDTVVAAVDPFFNVVVGFTPPAGPVTQPSNRHPAIPTGAKKLNDQISAFYPDRASNLIWIFNNLTGVITGKCTNAAGILQSVLVAADVDSCKNNLVGNNTVGYLLSGVIRFSYTDPPNPTSPGGTAIPLGPMALVAGNYSLPHLDGQGAPVFSGGNLVLDSFAATPPTPPPDCFHDAPSAAPSAQPFVTYNCIVYPDPVTKVWSGKLILTGLSVGTTAADYRVCRYSADYNGNGSMFSADFKRLENEEHPEVYGRVSTSLTRQNFLVIRGDTSCPTAPAIDFSASVFADYSTLQLQP